MLLESINFEFIRNLKQQKLNFDSTLNFVFGENGSGKTSILESIAICLTGKSFRTHRINDIITHGNQKFSIITTLRSEEYSTSYKIQTTKLSNKTISHLINNQKVSTKKQLTQLLPLFVLHPENFHIFSGSPGIRRNQIDWLLFHVKHGFSDRWYQYRHVLRQRNNLLKENASYDQITAWSVVLSELAMSIHDARLELINLIVKNFNNLLHEVSFPYSVTLQYKPGFNTQVPLLEQFEKNLTRDLAYGSTQLGPHRADIEFIDRESSKPLNSVLSRGQQKTLVILYILSQVIFCANVKQENVLFLIDDITSELDNNFLIHILELLNANKIQTIISQINAPEDFMHNYEHAVFHVEHGNIERVV